MAEGSGVFDTDVLIWYLRGSERAADWIDRVEERCVSVQTAMELVQGARDKQQQREIQGFLRDLGFSVLPLTPEIGTRALIYIEQYAIEAGMRAGDALVAATAAENGMPLLTGNAKHYRAIRGLDLEHFRP